MATDWLSPNALQGSPDAEERQRIFVAPARIGRRRHRLHRLPRRGRWLMRLVLDTNVVASGLLWDGRPARLLDAAQANEVELFTSRVLLAELTRILRREALDPPSSVPLDGVEGSEW